MPDMVIGFIVMFVTLTPIFLWIRSLLVGASRYVGPPAGPAFKPREPLCDQCGYCITGLNISADCPECGWPVRYSLPGGRRQSTVWQQHPFRLQGLREAARLQWALFRDRDFFNRLPVHEGHAAARHFWWATLFFILVADLVICLAIFPLIAAMGDLRESTLLAMKALAAIIGLLVPFILQAFVAFAACLWAQISVGIRDYRVSRYRLLLCIAAHVACYHPGYGQLRAFDRFAAPRTFQFTRVDPSWFGTDSWRHNHHRHVPAHRRRNVVLVVTFAWRFAEGSLCQCLRRGAVFTVRA